MIKRLLQELIGGKKALKHDREPTPEQEIATANEAIRQNDLKHAAFHVGCALVHDPNRAEWLALLNRIADSSHDPLSLAPLENQNWAGTVAIRAYFLARLGRLQEAINIIMQVVEALPTSAYIAWAIDWVDTANAVDAGPILRYFRAIADRIPEMLADPEVNNATTKELPRLIQVLCRRQLLDSAQLCMCVVILRRLGRLTEALEIAKENFANHPNYYSASGLAIVYRQLDDPEQAIALFQKAWEYDPSDTSVSLDIADMYLELGRVQEAAERYAEILEREPQHPWALPFSYAVQFLITNDEQWRARFEEFAKEHPDNQSIANIKSLFNHFIGHVLPSPGEATINMVRKFLSTAPTKTDSTGSLSATISALEAPSAVTAARRELARRAPDLKVTFAFKEIQKPDPRVPRKKVDYLLWQYSDTVEQPAFGMPRAEVAQEIAAIAMTPYSRPAWFRMAKDAALRIGRERVFDVLSTMIYPPDTPTLMPVWDWMYRNQFAAAFVCARMDEGWAGSLRRSVLLSLVNGPVDWTMDAALVALSWIAKEKNRDAEEEITILYQEVIDRGLRTPGYVCYLIPALMCALDLPNLDATKRKELHNILMNRC